MDHARHRAEPRPSHVWLFVGGVGGVLAGAVIATGLWMLVDGPPWRSGVPTAVPGASDQSTRRPSEPAGSQQIDDRAEVASARARAEPADPAEAAEPVLLVGDSLAVGIGPYVDAGLGERPLTVEAAEGRGTGTQVGLLDGYASSSAPVWVVSLGTNDNPEDFADLAPEVMELAGPDRCVVWFDVWRTDTDDAVNTTLATLDAEHPNLHLVPWNQTSERHPEWFSGYDVHPSSTGYAVRGQMAVDAVTNWCDEA